MGALEHFGSASDVVNYETAVTTIHGGAEIGPVAGWGLGVQAAWTKAEGSFASINVALPDEILADEDYDFSNINTYSDLDYSTLEVHATGTRQIHEDTSFTVGVGVIDFNDEASWVYGDLSGSIVYTRAGIETSF